MLPDRSALEDAIAALEAQRSSLGDAVVEVAVGPLLAQLAEHNRGISPSGDPHLKPATVMFLDVVDSTSMGSRLDPEDIHDVMDDLARRLTEIANAHHGRVIKYTGDGLLAVFGADTEHEHGAENGVRAALAMVQQAGSAMAVDDGAPGSLDVRVGLHTGLVLLGGGVEADHNIRGSAVNLAARMEQTAPPGGLRISHDTYRHVRGMFDVVEDPIALKGFADPIRSYLVRRAKPRAFRVAMRRIEGVETRMIGRDRELATLQHAYEQLHATRALRMITIIGDAGLGKSRLLYELQNHAEVQPRRCVLLTGRAQLGTRREPYGLLRSMLLWRFEIGEGDAVDDATRFAAAIEAHLPPGSSEGADVLCQLLGFGRSTGAQVGVATIDPQQIRARAFAAATQLLRAMATGDGGAPILMLLEDLHLADDGTLDFLEHVAREAADMPLLILTTARPELLHRRPDWSQDGNVATCIPLSPLDRTAADALVDELLQRLDVVPDRLRALVAENGDGIPFFLEEFVRMLLDDGLLVAADDQPWRVASPRLHTAHVPSTLMGVLQARLDALGAPERSAAQCASVVGHVFSERALAAIDPEAPAMLDTLIRRGLVVALAPSRASTNRVFSFQHHLLHQFTYQSILKRDRRRHHACAAAWLEEVADEGASEHLAAIGEHHERAGAVAVAVDYYARAAEQAASRAARDIVIELVGRALALAPVDDAATRWRLTATRERVLALGDDRVAHDADLVTMGALADVLNDDSARALAGLRLVGALVDKGEFENADAAARDAILVAERSGQQGIAARLWAKYAAAAWRMGDRSETRRRAEQGEVLSRTLDDPAPRMAILAILSSLLSDEGRAQASAALDHERLALALECGDRSAEASARISLGLALVTIGDSAASWEFGEALRLARELGWAYGESIAHVNLALVGLHTGDNQAMLDEATRAADIASLAGVRDLEAVAHLWIGHASRHFGRNEDARAALERSVHLFDLNNSQHYRLAPIAELATVELAAGEHAAALAHVGQVFEFLEAGGSLGGIDGPYLTFVNCYDVLSQLDDPRAARLLAHAHAAVIAQSKGYTDPTMRAGFLATRYTQAIIDEWDRQTVISS